MAGAIGRRLDGHPRPMRGALLLSGGFVALSHGKNDAQKTMGVIALALVVAGENETFHVDTWVVAAAALAISAGVYSGGWRIVRTLGSGSRTWTSGGRRGAGVGGALLWRGADLGFPISTTQVITGSVLGSGARVRFRHTRWGSPRNIGIAWVVTLPAACAVGAVLGLVGTLPGGHVILYLVPSRGLLVLFRMRRALFAGWEEHARPPRPRPDPEMLVEPKPQGSASGRRLAATSSQRSPRRAPSGNRGARRAPTPIDAAPEPEPRDRVRLRRPRGVAVALVAGGSDAGGSAGDGPRRPRRCSRAPLRRLHRAEAAATRAAPAEPLRRRR